MPLREKGLQADGNRAFTYFENNSLAWRPILMKNFTFQVIFFCLFVSQVGMSLLLCRILRRAREVLRQAFV